MFFLERSSQPQRPLWLRWFAAKPVDPAQFLGVQNRCAHRLWPGTTSDGTAVPPSPCIQRPNPSPRHVTWTCSGPFLMPRTPRIQGAKTPHPLPRPADGVVICGTLWERPAGTQTHSRRTGRKLGQLRCTRQGLVRVSKSNTKYGGQRGKTGAYAAPVIAPSISESSGIPKRKKSFFWRGEGLRPAVHRQVFIRRPGLHFGELT